MVHVPLMFLSEWREFHMVLCLPGKKNLMTACVSMLLKSRASPDMLPFSLCNKKRLAIRHSSFQRHYRRAKDLSAPPRNQAVPSLRIAVCMRTPPHFTSIYEVLRLDDDFKSKAHFRPFLSNN